MGRTMMDLPALGLDLTLQLKEHLGLSPESNCGGWVVWLEYQVGPSPPWPQAAHPIR